MDYSLYSRILQLCILRKAGKEGRLIHSCVLTNGLHSNPFMNTKLIIFYSKMGDMVTSRTLFDKMPERTVVTWTSLLSGYTQNGCSKEALLVFSAMRCEDSKCGKMEDACFIFESMAERDVVSWNAMIGGYVIHDFADDAFQLFRSMLRGGVIPDRFTLGNVMKAFLRGNAMMKVIQVHGFIIQLGFESRNDLTGSLIDAYAKCGSIRTAYHIYKSMPKKDAISCTALITGYARQGGYSRDSLISSMKYIRCTGDLMVILCSMLNMCAKTMSLDLGRQIHSLAFKCQSYNDVAMGNALIDMYSKSREIEGVKSVFNEKKQKNVISWTSLIAGYGKHGYGHKAIALYNQMEYEGWECFNSMVRKYEIPPRAEQYSCMVDLFARGGKLEEAYNLICKMNIAPTALLWGAILGACHIYGNMSLGEVAVRHLFNMEPKKSVNYVVLASIYASVGLWDSVSIMKRLME
ncbi:hypothetical protein RHSIM_Rhsim06G0241900 [Rhododendron simsii]|uniref:Pentatricopeptide repeat-containing protein n=1 Tax=Rhododendron simsii TaxID=118357 RepID=A0A834LKX4_RHOSS|nr:hypothetical protein RHSIM_Rhsim06G0241900 [Rhododendron simsii]